MRRSCLAPGDVEITWTDTAPAMCGERMKGMWTKPAGPGGQGGVRQAVSASPQGAEAAGAALSPPRQREEGPAAARASKGICKSGVCKTPAGAADKQGCGWASSATASGSARPRGNAWPRGDAQHRADAQHWADAQPHSDALSHRVMPDTQCRPNFCSTHRRELSG